MLRKLILGLAAVAALSTTALLPTAASAKGWKGGWHHHHHGHWGHGHGFFVGGYGRGYGGCYVKRLVETRYGLRYRVVNVCY